MECTSSAIQALVSFKKLHPEHRKGEVELCIKKAAAFIEKAQESDGSWFLSFYPSMNFYYLKSSFVKIFILCAKCEQALDFEMTVDYI